MLLMAVLRLGHANAKSRQDVHSGELNLCPGGERKLHAGQNQNMM